VDPAFKERVTAAFDGLAARYDTERGGFCGPVSDLLARAAATAARLGLAQVGVEAGDAEDPAYPDGSFDAVLASNVMFLLADPERAARRYAALLRPGGVFAFSWNVAEDPAWVPVIAAMDDHAADGGARRIPAPAAVRRRARDGGHAAAGRLPRHRHHAAGSRGALRQPGR
jgi:SAM-dependent methyltransferase